MTSLEALGVWLWHELRPLLTGGAWLTTLLAFMRYLARPRMGYYRHLVSESRGLTRSAKWLFVVRNFDPLDIQDLVCLEMGTESVSRITTPRTPWFLKMVPSAEEGSETVTLRFRGFPAEGAARIMVETTGVEVQPILRISDESRVIPRGFRVIGPWRVLNATTLGQIALGLTLTLMFLQTSDVMASKSNPAGPWLSPELNQIINMAIAVILPIITFVLTMPLAGKETLMGYRESLADEAFWVRDERSAVTGSVDS